MKQRVEEDYNPFEGMAEVEMRKPKRAVKVKPTDTNCTCGNFRPPNQVWAKWHWSHCELHKMKKKKGKR